MDDIGVFQDNFHYFIHFYSLFQRMPVTLLQTLVLVLIGLVVKKPEGKTLWKFNAWPTTEIVEESVPFRCHEGSHCGSVTLAMGNNKCKSTAVNVGFSYTLPLKEAFGSLAFTDQVNLVTVI